MRDYPNGARIDAALAEIAKNNAEAIAAGERCQKCYIPAAKTTLYFTSFGPGKGANLCLPCGNGDNAGFCG